MIVPASASQPAELSSLPLSVYAQIIQYDERPFFGLYCDNLPDMYCRTVWTKAQRDLVARYLAEAQREIEQETGYPLGVRYIDAARWHFSVDADERVCSGHPLALAKFARVVEMGRCVETSLASATAVSYERTEGSITAPFDPATVGPVSLPVESWVPSRSADCALDDFPELAEKLIIRHVGTKLEVHPSGGLYTAAANGNPAAVTLYVPWARLVSPDRANNPKEGWRYTDMSVYATQVDIIMRHTDTLTHAQVISPSGNETTLIATLLDHETGIIRVNNVAAFGGYRLRLFYRAGVVMDEQAQDTIIRLAHSKMPEEPCGCEIARRVWSRDRRTPDNTYERSGCRFGLSDGAWTAWQFTQAMRAHRPSIL